MTYADDLALALAIADEVDALTIAGSLSNFAVETKTDDTPVTEVDRAAEQLIRERLTAARPDDVIVGEEFGTTGGTTGASSNESPARRWVVDPIDGTKNFVRGVPAWATLIGLMDGGDAVVGVVSAPALGRRWYAALGRGAWGVTHVHGFPTEPRRLQVSQVNDVASASVSFSSLSGWEERGWLEPFLDLTRSVGRVRAFGDFWSYMLVAEGLVDVACEPELALHDMVALAPIVTEAGGQFTSLAGAPGPFGGDALATNGLLHTTVLAALASR
jgi:histidinol-phosphatase